MVTTFEEVLRQVGIEGRVGLPLTVHNRSPGAKWDAGGDSGSLCYPARVDLSEVFLSLGRPALEDLVRRISLGSLRTYQIFDSFKFRLRLNKLNAEHLRKSAPRLWERLEQKDEELARELAHAVLVSQIGFVVEVLDFLGISHDGGGFLTKETPLQEQLADGWQQRVLETFRDRYPEPLVRLYINHLAWEADKQAPVFAA